jgi:hypothetical protein
LLPEAERAEEHARLTEKYGPRNPSANGSGKARTLRKTRPMSALHTTH